MIPDMRSALWVSLSITIFLVVFAGAEEPAQTKRDGNWWLSLTPSVHSGYMLGIVDGIQAAGWFEIHSMNAEAYEKMQRQIGGALDGISNVELARNVTAVYRDHPEWRDLRVSAAVWLANMRLRGVQDEQLRNAVATIRQHTER